jgi:hypothetical protein
VRALAPGNSHCTPTGFEKREDHYVRGLACLGNKENIMTLCPVALAAGCKKCPAFSFCPVKTVIGDQLKDTDKPEAAVQGRP